ncbi:MAG: hypothetical protein MJ252_04555 [archaeon]|nr:hypothetical protein [archaeon]
MDMNMESFESSDYSNVLSEENNMAQNLGRKVKTVVSKERYNKKLYLVIEWEDGTCSNEPFENVFTAYTPIFDFVREDKKEYEQRHPTKKYKVEPEFIYLQTIIKTQRKLKNMRIGDAYPKEVLDMEPENGINIYTILFENNLGQSEIMKFSYPEIASNTELLNFIFGFLYSLPIGDNGQYYEMLEEDLLQDEENSDNGPN